MLQLQLTVVHQDIRKMLFFNNLYKIHDNFEKKRWQGLLHFTARDRQIDGLYSYDQAMLFLQVSKFTTLSKCCRGLIFAIEQSLEYNNIERKCIVSKLVI